VNREVTEGNEVEMYLYGCCHFSSYWIYGRPYRRYFDIRYFEFL